MRKSYYYTFKVEGLPFCGHVIVIDGENPIEQATKIAKEVVRNLEDTYFGFHNANSPFKPNELMADTPSLVSKPLSIGKVEIMKEEIINGWGDAHNPKLVETINDIWSCVDIRNQLRYILRAIYDRDCDELANIYDDECIWCDANEISFEQMCKETTFEEVAYQLFNHIMDDEDLKMIISFIRPRWIREDWWELLND